PISSNALLANLISFSNEIANVCSVVGGVDVMDVMRGVHLSQYFGNHNADGLPPIVSFLRAGCGFGGSCLPKDVKALIAHGRKAGLPMRLLESVIQVNDEQPRKVVALLEKHWADLIGIRVAVLGLAFKPGTSDVRESPAFPILRELLKRGAVLKAFDPVARDEARRVIGDTGIPYCETVSAALLDIDALVVVTAWPEFRELPALLRGRHPAPVFVDVRR